MQCKSTKGALVLPLTYPLALGMSLSIFASQNLHLNNKVVGLYGFEEFSSKSVTI